MPGSCKIVHLPSSAEPEELSSYEKNQRDHEKNQRKFEDGLKKGYVGLEEWERIDREYDD